MIANLKNIDLHYKTISVSEPVSDTVVLFLHEALGSIGQWKSFPEEFCEQLQLNGIVYERQGHGLSSPFSKERKADYLHEYALKELPAFIETVFDKDQQILLVGHSDGGTIALLYAHAFPERIERVITMAAHVINEPETIAGIAPAVEAYQTGKLEGLKKYHGDKTEELFYAWANIWRDASFLNWDITSEIAQTSLPGLFIQGADDQYGTAKQLELIEKEYSNGQTLLLENCGHHPHLEQPDRTLSAISNWLNS